MAKDLKQADLPTEALMQLVHAERGHMSARQRAEGEQALVARWTWDGIWLRTRPAAAWAIAMGVAMAIGAVVVFVWHGAKALSYAIEGGRIERSGFITAESAGQPRLRFSDGTEVTLNPGAKASLRSVDSRGARVSLSEGGAHVDVTHVSGARWLIDAGPFLITVTGTAFNVAWGPTDERLDVQMQRGSVQVVGPLSDEATVLRAGQHLIVRMRERETLIRSLEDEGTSPMPPGRAQDSNTALPSPPAVVGHAQADSNDFHPASPHVAAEARPAGPLTHATCGTGTQDWTAELAKGGFENIIRQAERMGLEACLADASSGDLAALADAARYGRHDEMARRALLAQRHRFPSSAPAHDASFLLGRLEEAERNMLGAIDWYDRYLAESPTGTYASEALGRKMNLTQRFYGGERARGLAADYLDRFPQGTYAARARTLVRAP